MEESMEQNGLIPKFVESQTLITRCVILNLRIPISYLNLADVATTFV